MSRWDHHPPCPGGCGQLADECQCRRPSPLGSMRVEPRPHEFAENVNDYSMCICGIPALTHDSVVPSPEGEL